MAAKFWRDRRGGITVLAATMLPALIGMAGLATEYGNALMVRSKTQRIADAAAFSGAMAYSSNASTDALNAAVSRIATLNGILSSAAVGSLVTSPTNDGNQAVQVTVTSSAPLGLSQILGTSSQISVTSTALAELKPNGWACIIALNGSGTGVTLSGSTAVTASTCAVSSNASVAAPNGTSITSPIVTYNSSTAPSSTTIANIHAPSGGTLAISKKATSDRLNTNTTITGEASHLTSVALLTSPSAPSPPSATNLAFNNSPASFSQGGCQFNLSGSTWTGTCSGNGPFNFNTVTLHGGLTVNFNVSGSTSAVYNFNGNIDGSNGTAINFGPGTYNISGGIIVGGGMTMSFKAGTFNIGKLASTCNSATGYSICNSGTSLSFLGSSTFVMAGGIYSAGNSILTLGTTAVGLTSPTSNSFNIGKAGDGNSLVVSGGAKTTFADATGTGDVFKMAGNLTSAGGSCLVVSAATDHDINGSIATAGGTYFGAGTYSVTGYVAAGVGGGGDVTCQVNGTSGSLGMTGSGVTFGIAASSTPSSGSCSGAAFCVASGYGHVNLTAPTSGSLTGLVVMGPTTSTNTAGATFAEGSSGTSLSGVFYLPYGPVTLSGAANVGNGTGQCLELIGSQITLSGGTALASTCTGLGDGTTGTTIVLVQ